MSIAIPQWLAPWLVGAGLLGVALALVVTVRAYLAVQRAEYYIVREEARQTGLRATLAVFIFILLTVIFLLIPRRAASPQSIALPTTPASQQQPAHTPTPLPSVATATHTATPPPTATEPFIPTSTPQATLPPAFLSPLPSSVPPPGDARFEFWTLAEGVDENAQPIRPASQFPVGIERVYLFFRYDGLLPNVSWTTVWYLNGELLSGGSSLWESRRPTGEWHVFLALDGGYPVGEYEVQVWLGDRLEIRIRFSVGGNVG